MPNRPYAVRAYRVALARPFQDIKGVRAALAAHRAGKSIGFSRRASLTAMGLLPRADGTYRLSLKYK